MSHIDAYVMNLSTLNVDESKRRREMFVEAVFKYGLDASGNHQPVPPRGSFSSIVLHVQQ